jgi:N-acetylglutamate synthase-like GNAT family acetyltransferase
MKNIRNLGYKTDCIIRNFGGTIEECENYYIVRMPDNPTFYSGNSLLFRSPPNKGSFENWMEVHDKEFGLDSAHVTFGWDSEERGEVSTFEENGFSVEMDSIMHLVSLGSVRPSLVDIEIKKIACDEDWEAVVELQLLHSEEEGISDVFRKFKSDLFKTYRKISSHSHGDWWGAFVGSKIVGNLGLYFDENNAVGRFQSIGTHPDYRKKGICSNLLWSVCRYAQEVVGVSELYICADVDSAAFRLYQGLGFDVCGVQYEAMLPCPFHKRFEQ